MRKVTSLTFAAFGIASSLWLAGCAATTKPAEEKSPADWSAIAGRDWQLMRIEAKDKSLTPMTPILASVNFTNDGKIAGSTGCNRYFGSYTRKDTALDVSPLGSTKMMCMEDAMEIEDAFIAAMADVKGWKVQDGDLMLVDGSAKSIMTFEPIQP
ncbi:hypothetical protein AUP42_06205 [Thalassospira lucentensis]|mgnify:CR=1 FL=1|uniref:DUF306 domain-containing protein n=1 Tax=Thalassospira lucentensis TaxID=168935 RepID=A0A154L150_9PROT|nr:MULTISPECIES: META domain-containing protein [Thalassospira]UKV14859.1 META domain-containing protein [Thalassospiraceae bacterium SW-3-3]KZB54986.1 hypothetical protein AUP41_18205 [Thalassospira xiamenensis]KZB61549.1 hypothetical protein AUP42_06205 [Thalassospira lucentensis]MAZ32716.1 META domain-containing protein [Thalassospira sp.]MBO9507198.1 META domain-containing protein [Thalassospira sp. A3_1]